MFRKKTNCIVSALIAGLVLAAIEAPASAQGFWDHRSIADPGPRQAHAMAYDSCRQVTVMFGGWDRSSTPWILYEGTREWDGETWTLRSTTGPGSLVGHAMAFDQQRCVTVLFGGHDGAGGPSVSDTWEWDGSTWTQRCANCPPPPRTNASMVYDSAQGAVLMFGGWGPGYMNDLWRWDGTTWVQVPTNAGPSPRDLVGFAYDPVRDRTMLFGGSLVSGPCGTRSDETWELNMNTTPAAWTLIPTSTQPSARQGGEVVYDLRNSVMLLFGGRDCAPNLLGDTWTWDGATWTENIRPGPAARITHQMVYDAARELVVLFGGLVSIPPNPETPVGDTWTFGSCLPRGDMNGDGLVNGADLSFFVAKLLNP